MATEQVSAISVLVDTTEPTKLPESEAATPDVVLINLENPSRDLLEDFFAMSRALYRVRLRCSLIRAMPGRLARLLTPEFLPMSSMACPGVTDQAGRRPSDPALPGFSRLQRELDDAKNALAERAVIGKAKSILMRRRSDRRARGLCPAPRAGDAHQSSHLGNCPGDRHQ